MGRPGGALAVWIVPKGVTTLSNNMLKVEPLPIPPTLLAPSIGPFVKGFLHFSAAGHSFELAQDQLDTTMSGGLCLIIENVENEVVSA